MAQDQTVENIQKALTFICVVIGLGIFYLMILTKLEVLANETKAKVLKQSADESWEGYLYQKTVDSIIEEKESDTETVTETSGTQQE